MKKIVVIFFTLISLSIFSQKIEGNWISNQKYENNYDIYLNINKKSSYYYAILEIPSKKIKQFKSLQIKNSTLNDKLFLTLFFEQNIIIELHFNNDNTCDGKLIQDKYEEELNLIKNTNKISTQINRPQHPKRPHYYKIKEVSFVSNKDSINLKGTLTIPYGKGLFPAVILVSGSGANKRDYDFMEHKPFLVLSDFLTRSGIAVLRYDERGIGESEGVFEKATTSDFAFDALSAINYLKNNKKIDSDKVGIIGHSEGGIVASMLASSDTTINFVVLLATPGLPISELLLDQNRVISELKGLSKEEIDINEELNKKFYEVLKSEKNNELIKEKIAQIVIDHTNSMPDSLSNSIEKDLPKMLETFTSPWFKYFIKLNPISYIREINQPVLAMNGAKDCQVNAIKNLNAIRNNLQSSNKKYTYILPDLNHFFQHAETGFIDEYIKIEETFSLEAMQIIARWILQLEENYK